MQRRTTTLVALCLCIAACSALPSPPLTEDVEPRQLQSAAAPPPPKATFSVWAAAKRFFASREKTKAKLSGASVPTTPAVMMTPKYGVSFKAMLTWYCAKPENKTKQLCHLKEEGKAVSELAKATTAESKEAFKEYCKVPEFKSKLICTMSAIRAKHDALKVPSSAKPSGAKPPKAGAQRGLASTGLQLSNGSYLKLSDGAGRSYFLDLKSGERSDEFPQSAKPSGAKPKAGAQRRQASTGVAST